MSDESPGFDHNIQRALRSRVCGGVAVVHTKPIEAVSVETKPSAERRLLGWLLAIVLCIFIITFVILWITAAMAGWKGNIFVVGHFTTIIGLPSAAALASCVVVIFRQAEGPIEFEAVFIKLKGAAGPVVLWVICFLAIVGAIKMLW